MTELQLTQKNMNVQLDEASTQHTMSIQRPGLRMAMTVRE